MLYRTYIIFSAILCLAACSQAQTSAAEPNSASKAVQTAQVPVTSNPAKANIAHAYTKAFNTRDVDGMLALATDDIEWISLNGRDLLMGADGAESLREAMVKYFESCGSCRASLKWTKTTDERVVALEEASWDGDGERKSQSALSVYEFEGDKIRRVYYFPAE